MCPLCGFPLLSSTDICELCLEEMQIFEFEFGVFDDEVAQ